MERAYDIVIDVPETQPGGTDWYHPHKHGTTAKQVSNGMEGALIVGKGKLDEVVPIKGLKEKIFVLQQIPYDTEGVVIAEDVAVTADKNGVLVESGTDRGTWINGQVQPTIRMRSGEVERWRFIHAGIKESIHLEIAKEEGSVVGNEPFGLGQRQLLHEIAVDGMPLGFMDAWKDLDLEPGYRSDVLVRLEKGTYWLIDEKSDASKNVNGKVEERKILAKVVVDDLPGNVPPDIDPRWRTTDWDQEQPSTESGKQFRQYILTALKNAKDDEPLLKDIEKAEYSQTDPINVEFDFEPTEPFTPMVNQASFTLNGERDGQRWINVSATPIPIRVRVKPRNESATVAENNGTANQWNLKTRWASHPFHIHVNPFQVWRKGPKPLERKELIWKDTLFVVGPDKRLSDEDFTNLPGETIYSRYIEYDGCAVLHCHILPHEDKGMMALVKYSMIDAPEVGDEQCLNQTIVGHTLGETKPQTPKTH